MTFFAHRFFAHRCHYHYRFLLLSLGCHPLESVTPHLFYLSDLVSPLFFVNLPTQFFPSGVTPSRVSPGAVRPPHTPLVTPLTTALMTWRNIGDNFIIIAPLTSAYRCCCCRRRCRSCCCCCCCVLLVVILPVALLGGRGWGTVLADTLQGVTPN